VYFTPAAAGVQGLVLFAHGSGSSRHSRRNRYVAEVLERRHHLATLLIDLLTPQEEGIDDARRSIVSTWPCSPAASWPLSIRFTDETQ
jgi:hypothetical protein